MKTPCLADHARRVLPSLILAVWILTLGGCVRMQVLPTEKKEVTMPLSEPRPVDHLRVPHRKDPTKTYRIGPRDIIRVDVRKDPTLSQVYMVTEEGNILLPNIGAFKVSNLTTPQAEQRLNTVLAQYIREPEAKVGVQDYRSKVVYVVGQVNNPGPQPMRADMLTLQEAIFAAGLPTAQAAIQRTHVISPAMEHPIVRQIDLTDILYKGRMAENMLLRPNDIVYVPARYSINLTSAMLELVGPLEQVYTLMYGPNYSYGNNNNNNNGGGNNATVTVNRNGAGSSGNSGSGTSNNTSGNTGGGSVNIKNNNTVKPFDWLIGWAKDNN